VRVVIVSGIYPPDIGGPATHASTLMAALTERGHQVHVLTVGDDVRDDPRVTTVPRRWPWPARSAAVIAWLCGHRSEFDVAYATGLPFPVVAGARLARRPVVVKIVGDHAWERSRRRGLTRLTFDQFQISRPRDWRVRIMRWARASAVRHADVVVTPSEYLADVVGRWVPSAEIEVVPNGVSGAPARDGRRDASTLRALYIGRLVSHKRVDVLVDAIAGCQGVTLEVVGDGPELGALRRRARTNGIEDRVRFTGALDHERALEHLSRADVLLSASSYEGLPHSHLEALVAGVPVVTTDAGGSKEVIGDGLNGLVVLCGTAVAFAEKLTMLRDDRELLAKLSANAEAAGEAWGFARCADRLETILGQVALPKPRAVYVGNTRLESLRAPTGAGKLALHRPWLQSVWLARGTPRIERERGGVAVWLPDPHPAPLGSALFYTIAPLIAVGLTAGRCKSAIVCKSPFEATGALIARGVLPRGLRPRVQIELHGDWQTATRLYGGHARRVVAPAADLVARWALRRADRVRAVSELLAARAQEIGCSCPIDVHVTYSDFGEFLESDPLPVPDDPSAVFVGVLEPYKAVDILLRAWEEVWARLPAARLTVIGAGRRQAALRDQLAGSPAVGSVRFQAPVPRRALRGFIDDAWCLVLPSRSEGLPRIVLEAMARGRAVVATRVGGMAELIDDGHSGWLIKPDDPKALADRLIDVLSSRDEATAMGVVGRRRAEERDPAAEYSAGIARLADWIASG